MMISNSTNINKTNNHLSSKFIELKTAHDISNVECCIIIILQILNIELVRHLLWCTKNCRVINSCIYFMKTGIKTSQTKHRIKIEKREQ